MLRTTALLKRGWVPASLLITRLENATSQTPLVVALGEDGRIVRTNSCCATADVDNGAGAPDDPGNPPSDGTNFPNYQSAPNTRAPYTAGFDPTSSSPPQTGGVGVGSLTALRIMGIRGLQNSFTGLYDGGLPGH